MLITLNLIFTKASGKKHTLKISDAKPTQETPKVKALMQHIVNQNLLDTKGDPIVSALEATLQNTTETEINL